MQLWINRNITLANKVFILISFITLSSCSLPRDGLFNSSQKAISMTRMIANVKGKTKVLIDEGTKLTYSHDDGVADFFMFASHYGTYVDFIPAPGVTGLEGSQTFPTFSSQIFILSGTNSTDLKAGDVVGTITLISADRNVRRQFEIIY